MNLPTLDIDNPGHNKSVCFAYIFDYSHQKLNHDYSENRIWDLSRHITARGVICIPVLLGDRPKGHNHVF
eukprot:IDg7984t1